MPQRLAPRGAAPVSDRGGRSGAGRGAGQPSAGAATASGAPCPIFGMPGIRGNMGNCRSMGKLWMGPWGVPLPLIRQIFIRYH